MTDHKSKPIIDLPSKKQLEETVLQPYSEEELSSLSPEVNAKLKKLLEFLGDTNLKQAYPNYDQFMHVPGQHDTRKWLHTVKEIYQQEKNGMGRVDAVRHATSGWNPMETYDFLNWLRFYEEGAHLKYKTASEKTAQLWYENNTPGYFLHVKQDPPKPAMPGVSGQDVDFAKEEVSHSDEKKQIIEKQRNKIIGRLDSAEKLLRSHEGQIFAGKELESLMESIYQLKKKIQLVNKLSVSTRLYEDMIIRQANVLQKSGYEDAAYLLSSMAEDGDGMPAPAAPAPPDQPTGDIGGLPSVGPGMAQTPPESAPNETSPGLNEFLEGLETGNITTDEDLEVQDVEDELLVSEAQVAPPAPKVPPPAEPPATEEPLEVKENEVPSPGADVPSPKAKDFDHMIDSVFANVTIEDVIAKLEDISKIFKTREIPRQLAVVDMMLDALNLASLFPSLSEAINKSLESNNYVSSRLDDILSRLQGSIKGHNVDLKGESPKEQKPEVAGVKKNLEEQDQKEKARKQMRKDVENQELESGVKETPEVDLKGDLAAPATPPAKPPVAPTPPAP